MKKNILLGLVFFISVIGNSYPSLVKASDDGYLLSPSEKSLFVLSGYGITHKGLGETKTNVETVDFVVGYERFITNTFGHPLVRGRHSFVVEIPIHVVVAPWEEPMIGINFLARWTFDTNKKIIPYIFGGGGPVYTEANIPGLGAKLNGNWQFGGGLNILSSNNKVIIIEYRFHHISNLSTSEPNDPLNSSKVLVGIKF